MEDENCFKSLIKNYRFWDQPRWICFVQPGLEIDS